LVRRFNLREGLKPEDDRLPRGLHKELAMTGDVLTQEELDYMIKEYYQLRGWDENGTTNP
jgi:aldehyde:ferredoxin oxidoreductase